jgi:hypothetical protein
MGAPFSEKARIMAPPPWNTPAPSPLRAPIFWHAFAVIVAVVLFALVAALGVLEHWWNTSGSLLTTGTFLVLGLWIALRVPKVPAAFVLAPLPKSPPGAQSRP